MTRRDAHNPEAGAPGETDVFATFPCKLFSDTISERLCLLRKKELSLKGGFSCKGCRMDSIISKRLKQVTDVLGTARDPNG